MLFTNKSSNYTMLDNTNLPKILFQKGKLHWNVNIFFFPEIFFFSIFFNIFFCVCLFDPLDLLSFLGKCQNEKCFRKDILARGKYLQSRNGTYKLHLRKNGNLVLTCKGRPIWTSFTSNNTVDFLYFDEEGISLILRGKDNSTVWRAPSKGLGKELVLQDDGKLVLYNSCNTSIWEIGDNKKCREGLLCLFNAEFLFQNVFLLA